MVTKKTLGLVHPNAIPSCIFNGTTIIQQTSSVTSCKQNTETMVMFKVGIK